jgi:hypothetical protein
VTINARTADTPEHAAGEIHRATGSKLITVAGDITTEAGRITAPPDRRPGQSGSTPSAGSASRQTTHSDGLTGFVAGLARQVARHNCRGRF